MYSLVINSFKATPSARRVLPCAFYHAHNNPLNNPKVHTTTKVDDFYIPPSFPDESEAQPTVVQHQTTTQSTQEWEELNSTQSEADIKADRGEATPSKRGNKDDVFEPEADLEPKLDEM